MRSLLTFFNSVKGNKEKVEQISLNKRKKENSFERKQDRYMKDIVDKAKSIVRQLNL